MKPNPLFENMDDTRRTSFSPPNSEFDSTMCPPTQSNSPHLLDSFAAAIQSLVVEMRTRNQHLVQSITTEIRTAHAERSRSSHSARTTHREKSHVEGERFREKTPRFGDVYERTPPRVGQRNRLHRGSEDVRTPESPRSTAESSILSPHVYPSRLETSPKLVMISLLDPISLSS